MGLLFENETCSRCGGSGNYSYCQMYGTRCFKCQGAKSTLTKRGAAAQAYLVQLQTIALQDLKPGQIIEVTGITHGGQMYRYKAPVLSVEATDQTCQIGSTDNGVTISRTVHYVCIKTVHAKMGEASQLVDQNATLRVWPNSAENIAAALAYQASLTQSGTVRKNKQNKAKVQSGQTDK